MGELVNQVDYTEVDSKGIKHDYNDIPTVVVTVGEKDYIVLEKLKLDIHLKVYHYNIPAPNRLGFIICLHVEVVVTVVGGTSDNMSTLPRVDLYICDNKGLNEGYKKDIFKKGKHLKGNRYSNTLMARPNMDDSIEFQLKVGGKAVIKKTVWVGNEYDLSYPIPTSHIEWEG